MGLDNYINTTYSAKEKPFTTYPRKLIQFLVSKHQIKEKSKVLDVCCGRGEFINEFINCGLEGYGVDFVNEANILFSKVQMKTADLTKEKLPYPDNFFDVVYSKSMIEHFYYPEKIFEECRRVLKPGGIIITMTPMWEYNISNFYEDFTHKTPFTIKSLEEIHKVFNFKEIKVESFKQLPVLWKRNIFSSLISLISFLVRIFVPNFFKSKSKFIFFSKEIMLLSSAIK